MPIHLEQKDMKLRSRGRKLWTPCITIAPCRGHMGQRLSFSSLTKEFPNVLNRTGVCKPLHRFMRCPFSQAGLTMSLDQMHQTTILRPCENSIAPCGRLNAGKHPSDYNVRPQAIRTLKDVHPRLVLHTRFATGSLRRAGMGLRVSLAFAFALESPRCTCPCCRRAHMEIHARGSHLRPRRRAGVLLPFRTLSYPV